MNRCENTNCLNCKTHHVHKVLVCVSEPDLLMYSTDLLPWIVRCKSFQPKPTSVVEVFTNHEWNEHEGPDGLYPGQLKPPPDYTDVDPEEDEEAVCQLPGPETGKDCKT